jgi:hypothetical protein
MPMRPIQLRDAQHQILQFNLGLHGMNSSRGGTPYTVYVGYANPGTLVTDAGWLILKMTYDSTGTIVRVRYATEGGKYADWTKAWDTSSAFTITEITKAAKAQVTTSAAHGYSTGDRVEIIGSNATEPNGDGYGSVMYKIEKVDATKFTLVDMNTDLDVDSTGWVAAGTSGSVYKRSYANHTFS